jgi:hypothetical protein
MSATGRRGRGRRRPVATGRPWRAGLVMTPCRVSRSSVDAVASPRILATGTPRSVITTSSPSRTRSSQWLRLARSSLTATSMPTSVHNTANGLVRIILGDGPDGPRRSATAGWVGAGDLGDLLSVAGTDPTKCGSSRDASVTTTGSPGGGPVALSEERRVLAPVATAGMRRIATDRR